MSTKVNMLVAQKKLRKPYGFPASEDCTFPLFSPLLAVEDSRARSDAILDPKTLAQASISDTRRWA